MGDDYGSGGEWDPGAPPEPPTLTDDFVGDTIPGPDCENPKSPLEFAYCASAPPGKGTERERVVLSAIDRIRLRGSACAEIAARATDLMATDRLRFFDGSAHATLYGQSSGFGGSYGVLLDESYWLAYVEVRDPAGRTFDNALVHEVEHNLGRDHVREDVPFPTTPNAFACGG